MSGLTLRERAEEAVKAATDFEVNLGDDPSADDVAKLVDLANDAAELTHQFKTLSKARGDLGGANEALTKMGVDPGDDEPDENDKLSGYSGVTNPKGGMTIGEAFATSPAYQEYVKANVNSSGELTTGRIGNSAKVEFEGISLGAAGAALRHGDVKNLVTGGSDTSGGAFIEPTRFPGVIDGAPFDEFTLWDLCTKIPVTTDAFKWVEITGKTNNADFVPEATDAGVLSSEFPTDGTVTDAAGGLKPESDLVLAVRTGVVETVAHTIPVTRQAAADAPQVMAIINAFMRDGLDDKIEDGILNGNGTSPQLKGLLGGGYAINALAGVTTAGRVDAFVTAINTIRQFDRSYRPNAVLVNSTDWFSDTFLTKKDSSENYMLTSPTQAPGAINLWGLRVIVTDAVPAGTQVVGDWRYALIADRMRAQMYMTDSHKDWFARNILAILAEQRLGFGVMAPKAFATITA